MDIALRAKTVPQLQRELNEYRNNLDEEIGKISTRQRRTEAEGGPAEDFSGATSKLETITRSMEALLNEVARRLDETTKEPTFLWIGQSKWPRILTVVALLSGGSSYASKYTPIPSSVASDVALAGAVTFGALGTVVSERINARIVTRQALEGMITARDVVNAAKATLEFMKTMGTILRASRVSDISTDEFRGLCRTLVASNPTARGRLIADLTSQIERVPDATKQAELLRIFRAHVDGRIEELSRHAMSRLTASRRVSLTGVESVAGAGTGRSRERLSPVIMPLVLGSEDGEASHPGLAGAPSSEEVGRATNGSLRSGEVDDRAPPPNILPAASAHAGASIQPGAGVGPITVVVPVDS